MNITTRVEGSNLSITIGAANVSKYTRLQASAAGFVVAGIAAIGDVIVERDALANSVGVASRATNAPGTQFGIAVGAIAVGDELYAAANGAVSSTQATGAIVIGRAVSAAADTQVVNYFVHSVV